MPEPIGRRPVRLLSRSPAFEYLNKVIVAEVSTTIPHSECQANLGVKVPLRRFPSGGVQSAAGAVALRSVGLSAAALNLAASCGRSL